MRWHPIGRIGRPEEIAQTWSSCALQIIGEQERAFSLDNLEPCSLTVRGNQQHDLDRYVDEQVFRFNNRYTRDNPLDDADRFMLAVSQVSGKRLTYAELTGKDEETRTF